MSIFKQLIRPWVNQLLTEQFKGNIEVLMISEVKVDDSVQIGNFLNDGFSTPCRSDRDSKVGGIKLFVREDIPSKHLQQKKNNKRPLCITKFAKWQMAY